MQYFIDSATGKKWAFDDDVRVIEKDGVLTFKTARGAPLSNVPKTLQRSAR